MKNQIPKEKIRKLFIVCETDRHTAGAKVAARCGSWLFERIFVLAFKNEKMQIKKTLIKKSV